MNTLSTMFFSSTSSMFSIRSGCPCVVVWTWVYFVAFVVPRLPLLCVAGVAVCSFRTLLVSVCDAVKLYGGKVMNLFTYVACLRFILAHSSFRAEMLWLFCYGFHG
jgi:hypothetical protein